LEITLRYITLAFLKIKYMQISASLSKDLVEEIKVIQDKEMGMPSFSQMVETLLREAVNSRKTKKSKK
jgi:metal-responsive CopG/Arc/MetJ family transcriptional regulator